MDLCMFKTSPILPRRSNSSNNYIIIYIIAIKKKTSYKTTQAWIVRNIKD